MFFALFLLATIAPESVFPPSPGAKNVVQLFSTDDYPKKAAKVGMEGRVIARLIVSTRGTVRKCEILESSGWAILDKQTCKILKKRARFSPARNQQGKPIEDIFTTPPIMWRLDDRRP
jgi:protein TonB